MKKSKAITNLLVVAIVANNTTGINALENQTEDIINNEEVIELKEVTTEEIVEEKEETGEKKEGGDGEGGNSTTDSPNTVGGSSNAPESNPPQSGEQSVNIGDTVQSDTALTPTPEVQEVDNENDLISAVTQDGARIKLVAPIKLTKKVNITAKDVTIDGNYQTISQNGIEKEDLLVVNKGIDVTIKNLTVDNYRKAGINLYQSQNTRLENITLNGDNVGLYGVEINGATADLTDIKTSNHKTAGIRINNSKVTLNGGNSHTNDTKQLEFLGSNNTLINNVTTEQELIDAVAIPNAQINILNNITLTKELVINKDGVKINGGDKVIDCNKGFKITIKPAKTGVQSSALNVEISNLTFKNYRNQGLALFNAKDTKLTNITLQGNEYTLENKQRSTVGLDISNSTATIDGIKSINHIYRGIQIKKGSKVTLQGSIKHFNDSLHIQLIDENGKDKVELINADNYYKEKTTVQNESKNQTETNYYTREVIKINTAKEFAENVRNSGTILSLNTDIKFDESMIDELDKYNPQMLPDYAHLPQFKSQLECNVQANIIIDGNGKTIDLNNICGLVTKGDNIEIKNVTITNALTNGVTVFNSNNATLNNVTVKESKKSGIVANGSNVNVVNCKTINNGESGIMATRSRTLDNPEKPTAYRDSKVIIEGDLYQEESNRCMIIRNVEMVKTSDHKQDNQIIIEEEAVAERYNKIVNDEVKSTLSDLYKLIFKDWFEANNIPFNKEFGIQEIDFMKVLDRIDVTKQGEYLENGVAVVMKNDGSKDETENFKKLLRYATLHGKELYFPAGTYKISSDIDLNQLNTPAFSNVKITGDSNGLSIIDGSLSQTMIKIINSNYHSYMNQVNINNLVFKNIGLELNGVYKKNISINNNVFVDGKYTTENNKITMVPYITANNGTYEIEKNIFLRGQKYAGRGISTYATKNTVIKDNFFGNLEGKDDALTMIPSLANKLNLLTTGRTVTGRQGNFFTCINNERRDTNVTIQNNYFNMNESREIEGIPANALISGIAVSKEGQRKDHIIYSKGYNGLNIVGNYFKGMENGAAGGVKLRNGNGAYIGSNHFKDVPLLTYIYGDLTKGECLLYNTTIYNNFFHETKNIGKEGTGILYYQSFKNGDTLNFSNGDILTNAIGDVKNFVVYNNKFFAGEGTTITMSNRATAVKDQFLMYGNKYEETGELVNYNKGNMTIEESSENVVLAAVNNGYNIHKIAKIPLYPAKVDKSQLSLKIEEVKVFLESIKDQIGYKEGQYSIEIAEKISELLKSASLLLQDENATQRDINNYICEIDSLIEKLKRDINTGTGNDNDIEVDEEVKLPIDDNDNPQTGDVGVLGYIGLGLTSILGIFINNRKKKK